MLSLSLKVGKSCNQIRPNISKGEEEKGPHPRGGGGGCVVYGMAKFPSPKILKIKNSSIPITIILIYQG